MIHRNMIHRNMIHTCRVRWRACRTTRWRTKERREGNPVKKSRGPAGWVSRRCAQPILQAAGLRRFFTWSKTGRIARSLEEFVVDPHLHGMDLLVDVGHAAEVERHGLLDEVHEVVLHLR